MPDRLTHPLAYRLWRLRRLYLFALALPLIALLVLAPLTDGQAFLLQPTPALLLAAGWTATITGLLLRFPRAPGEAIIITLALTALILLTPMAEWLATHREEGPLEPPDIVGLAILTAFAALLLLLLFAGLVNWLCKVGPRPNIRRLTTLRTDLDPETAFAIMKPAPNRLTPWSRSGPADESGCFGTWVKSVLPDQKGSDARPSPQLDDAQPAYWVRVIEEAPLSCGIVDMLPDGRTEVTHLTVEPDGPGSRIVQRSVDNILTLWEVFVLHMADFYTDYVVASIDSEQGHVPCRAIWLLPFDAPTLWLQRKLPAKGEPQF